MAEGKGKRKEEWIEDIEDISVSQKKTKVDEEKQLPTLEFFIDVKARDLVSHMLTNFLKWGDVIIFCRFSEKFKKFCEDSKNVALIDKVYDVYVKGLVSEELLKTDKAFDSLIEDFKSQISEKLLEKTIKKMNFSDKVAKLRIVSQDTAFIFWTRYLNTGGAMTFEDYKEQEEKNQKGLKFQRLALHQIFITVLNDWDNGVWILRKKYGNDSQFWEWMKENQLKNEIIPIPQKWVEQELAPEANSLIYPEHSRHIGFFGINIPTFSFPFSLNSDSSRDEDMLIYMDINDAEKNFPYKEVQSSRENIMDNQHQQKVKDSLTVLDKTGKLRNLLSFKNIKRDFNIYDEKGNIFKDYRIHNIITQIVEKDVLKLKEIRLIIMERNAFRLMRGKEILDIRNRSIPTRDASGAIIKVTEFKAWDTLQKKNNSDKLLLYRT